MKFIKVTLECVSASNKIPVELQQDIPPETEWRTAYIKVKDIMAIYPDVETGAHIAFNTENSWLVREDLETVYKLLKDS